MFNFFWLILAVAVLLGIWLGMNRFKASFLSRMSAVANLINGSIWDNGKVFGDWSAKAHGTYKGRVVEISEYDRPGYRYSARQASIELTYREPKSIERLTDRQLSEAAMAWNQGVPPHLRDNKGNFYLDRNRAGWKWAHSLPELELISMVLEQVDRHAADIERVAGLR